MILPLLDMNANVMEFRVVGFRELHIPSLPTVLKIKYGKDKSDVGTY